MKTAAAHVPCFHTENAWKIQPISRDGKHQNVKFDDSDSGEKKKILFMKNIGLWAQVFPDQ